MGDPPTPRRRPLGAAGGPPSLRERCAKVTLAARMATPSGLRRGAALRSADRTIRAREGRGGGTMKRTVWGKGFALLAAAAVVLGACSATPGGGGNTIKIGGGFA